MKDRLNHLHIVAHLLTLLYVFLLGWWALLIIPFALVVFHLGQSAYAHRIFTHSVNINALSPRAHFIGQFLSTLCGWGSPLSFATIHRVHHAHSGTEKDPYEPKYVGRLNVLLGRYDLKTKVDLRFFRRAYKRPYAAFFHKNYFTVAWLSMVLFAPVFVAGFWLRYVGIVMIHEGGPEDSVDTSVDKFWLWPLLWGDEAHELHHEKSYLARHHKLDIIYWFVRLYQIIP